MIENIGWLCSEFAQDSRAGEALVVQNNNPRDALAQQVEKVDLTNFKVFIPQDTTLVTGKFILRTGTLNGWQPKIILTRI